PFLSVTSRASLRDRAVLYDDRVRRYEAVADRMLLRRAKLGAPVSGIRATERVAPPPPAGNPDQRELTDRLRQTRLDDEGLSYRFQPEEHAEHEKRGSGCPSLRAAGGRVLDGVARALSRIAGESLR